MSGGLYFAAVSAVLISGCAADYLNHYETVTLATGDTNNAIMLLQTADPFNPNSNNTHIEGDGQRIAGAAQRYRGVAATAGVVPTSKVGLVCAGGSGNNREAMERVKRFRRQPGCHRWPAVPMRLVFVTVAAVAAYITQYAIQRGERVQLAVSNWIGPCQLQSRAALRLSTAIPARSLASASVLTALTRRRAGVLPTMPRASSTCVRRAAEALDTFLAASRPLHCSFVDAIATVGLSAIVSGPTVAAFSSGL